jgi:hypothetical protein
VIISLEEKQIYKLVDGLIGLLFITICVPELFGLSTPLQRKLSQDMKRLGLIETPLLPSSAFSRAPLVFLGFAFLKSKMKGLNSLTFTIKPSDARLTA